MRHFLSRELAPPVSLPARMLPSPLGGALVLGPCAPQRFAAPELAAVPGAVDLAVVARRAHEDLATAERAGKDSELRLGGCFASNLPTHRGQMDLETRTMAKIGRNDSCPCGSGKKYKRCCLTTPDPASIAVLANPLGADDDLCDCCIDALNERADRALDLILEGRVDDGEAMAHDLMRDFPGEVEGIDLLSMVSEARGQRARAADLLRRAIDIVRVHPGHDAETRMLMHQRLKELEQRA
jgi:hypothetical protein